MFFYIILFLLVSSLLYFQKKTSNNKYGKYVFIILFLVSAFRFDVGYDFMMYWDFLTSTAIDFKTLHNGNFEFGNILLFKISRLLDIPQFFFISTSFIIITSIYITLKNYSADFSISTLFFLALPIFFFNSLGIVRQFVAISIVFYGVRYLLSKEIIKFFLIVLLASLFHKSAFVSLILPIMFLQRIKFSLLFYIAALLISFFGSNLIAFAASLVLPEYYVKFYITQNLGIGGDKLLLLFQLIAFIFLLIPLKKLKTTSIFYLNSFYLGVAIWGALAPFGHAGIRGTLYFTIFILLIIPEVIAVIPNGKKLVKESLYLVSIVFYILTLYLGVKNPNKDPNIPYRFSPFTDHTEYKIDKKNN